MTQATDYEAKALDALKRAVANAHNSNTDRKHSVPVDGKEAVRIDLVHST